MIAGVMVVPGRGTSSQNGSRSRLEKWKAILLSCIHSSFQLIILEA